MTSAVEVLKGRTIVFSPTRRQLAAEKISYSSWMMLVWSLNFRVLGVLKRSAVIGRGERRQTFHLLQNKTNPPDVWVVALGCGTRGAVARVRRPLASPINQ